MVSKETEFIDTVTAVPAAWWNLVQEFLAGFVNLQAVRSSSTQITVDAGDSDDVASVYVKGQMRRRDTDVSVTVSGTAGVYDILATADSGDNLFALESVKQGNTPSATLYRKIAEVDWSGTSITAVRQTRGRVESHGHSSATTRIAHSSVTDLTADDHSQYVFPDATRPYTGPVASPGPSSSLHLANKSYADTVLSAFPVGALLFWGAASTPPGYLLCQGQAVSRTSYPSLFAEIGTTYGAGDGSSTFNVPGFTGRMPLGKSASGTGSLLGSTGGSLNHRHSQPNHTHTQDSHSHGMTAHTHAGATSAASATHTHTQGNTGFGPGDHTHFIPNHDHSAGGIGIGTTADASGTARVGGVSTVGLFAGTDLANSATDSTSHSHGNGSFTLDDVGTTDVTGSSASSSIGGHNHAPSLNAYGHDHSAGDVSGATGMAGASAPTSADGSHAHTNPSTAGGGSHIHSTGTTGSALTTTQAGGAVATGGGGNQDTGTATPPFLAVNILIKAI